MYRLHAFPSVLGVIITGLMTASQLTAQAQSVKENTGIYRDGDLILGGLIPVHFTKNTAQHPGAANCGGTLHPRGYMGVEAMLYAVERINNDTKLLPNMTLGVDIKDSCGSVDSAIMECLKFDFIRTVFSSESSAQGKHCSSQVADPMQSHDEDSVNGSSGQVSRDDSAGRPLSSDCCTKSARKVRHTVAIVGAAFSGVTMAIASLAGLFYIPVVSFASTSRLLGDRARFRYFFRTVPSDNLQALAMVNIIHTFQWSFVITVASDNEYGRSGISALKEMAQRDHTNHVCVVVDELFSRKGGHDDIVEIFNKIKQFPMAKVIIVYAEFPDAKYFLEEAKSAGLRDYVFIASDSWAGSVDVVRGMDDVISSVICLRPPIVQVRAFRETLQRKLLSNVSEHPWTTQYKEYKSNLCKSNIEGACKMSIHNEGYIPYIMDAVYVVAHALHKLLQCSKDSCKRTISQLLLRSLPAFIQNISIEGLSNKLLSFDENGGASGTYDLYSLKIEGGRYEYTKFGNWTSLTGLRMDKDLIQWNNDYNTQPNSACSHECQKEPPTQIGEEASGNDVAADKTTFRSQNSPLSNKALEASSDITREYKIPMSRFPECCWTCEKCSGKSITNSTRMRNCIDCPHGTWPNTNKSDCFPIQAEYLRWSDWWAIFILTISGVGVVAVTCTVIVFIRYHSTAVVRAASHQLCFVLLFGICLFFVTPIVFVMKPSKLSCTLLPFMIGISFSVVVGTILIKTNRISRIFNEKLLQTGRVACLGNQWQLILMICLVVVEIVVCLCWIRGSNATPFPEAIYSQTSREGTLTCNLSSSKIGFSVWLIYNVGLVIICTYQAFLVRKVPQNYNESKFIAFTMITICITVLVYVPSYLGTSAWYRTVISCFMFVFLGTVTWVSIFIPKLHIILFRPHKNIPMRPSVSSVTLGVFAPSPSVVSNYCDSAMRSRSNTYVSGNDGSVFRFDPVDNRGCHDENNGSIPYKERERSRKTSQVRFKVCDNNGDSFTAKCDDETQMNANSDLKRCKEYSYTSGQPVVKKQSVVRFEEDGEVSTSVREGPHHKKSSILRRHSDIGILRNRYCIDFDVTTSNGSTKTGPENSTVWTKNSTTFLTNSETRETNYWKTCNGIHSSLAEDTLQEQERGDTLGLKQNLSPNSDRRRKISVVDRPIIA